MIKQICKWLVFKCIYPFYYSLVSWREVNQKKVIFVENHQDYLTDNFQRLYKRLEENDYELHVHYLKVASSSWWNVIKKSLVLIKDMGDAGCVFLNESNSLFGAFRLRKETEMVQIWHACGAFKKWGYSVADKSFGENETSLRKYSGHRNYTLVPVSGAEVCWAYEEAFGLKPEKELVRPLGVSRTDVFFDRGFQQKALEKLRATVPNLGDRKIMLYAPTFRGTIDAAKPPNLPDMELLCNRFCKEYVLLVKQHPFIKEACVIEERYASFCIEISKEMTMEELMVVADICITDYSSIIFDFSLMQKPILFYAYDLDAYYDERGFYYPYETFVPGPVLKTSREVADCISAIEEYDYNRLKTFRKRFMSGCDGHSTERILNAVFGEAL